MATLALAWCALCALTARKLAHGHVHSHGRKAGKNEFWRELRHKSGCCCFGWAVYAPCACYMNLRALCVSKLAKCLLICPGGLMGDPNVQCVVCESSFPNCRLLKQHRRNIRCTGTWPVQCTQLDNAVIRRQIEEPAWESVNNPPCTIPNPHTHPTEPPYAPAPASAPN